MKNIVASSQFRALLNRIKLLNPNVLAIGVIFLCSLAMLNWMGGYLYAYWDRILVPFNPEVSISGDFYVWDYSTLGGQYFSHQAHFLYHAIMYVFNLVLPLGIANTILFWLLFLICGLSMYAFVMKTTKFNGKEKAFVALVASLLYMFNPYWIFRLGSAPLILFILAFLPLLMLVVREALISADVSVARAVKYALLASLITMAMSSGLAEISSGLATAIFVGLYITFLSVKRLKLKPFIITLTCIFVFSIVANLWWIAPNLMHQTVGEALARTGQYQIDTIATLELAKNDMNYSNVLRGMGFYIPPPRGSIVGTPVNTRSPDALLYDTPLFIAISTLIPLIGFASVLSRAIRKSSEVLIFALIALVIIPLFLTGFNPPFGFIIRWLVDKTPIFVFRRPTMYMFLLYFPYAYMFSLGILALINFAKQLGRQRR